MHILFADSPGWPTRLLVESWAFLSIAALAAGKWLCTGLAQTVVILVAAVPAIIGCAFPYDLYRWRRYIRLKRAYHQRHGPNELPPQPPFGGTG